VDAQFCGEHRNKRAVSCKRSVSTNFLRRNLLALSSLFNGLESAPRLHRFRLWMVFPDVDELMEPIVLSSPPAQPPLVQPQLFDTIAADFGNVSDGGAAESTELSSSPLLMPLKRGLRPGGIQPPAKRTASSDPEVIHDDGTPPRSSFRPHRRSPSDDSGSEDIDSEDDIADPSYTNVELMSTSSGGVLPCFPATKSI
jgi:hypothetical protein